MKPITLTEETKKALIEKFQSELDDYVVDPSETTITMKTNIGVTAKQKIILLFSQQAYLRMMSLVEYFTGEVGWYGLVDRIDEKLFHIYDVKVCKQTVDGAKVDTTDEDTLEFYESLTDDEAEHLHFQAHSHVKMSTTASAIDIQNQRDIIRNMGMKGFYIFQIWNKNNDINTYLYDLENNIFYDRKDVTIMIEDSEGTLDDFILSASELVKERKVTQWAGSYNKDGYKKSDSYDKDYNYDKYYGGY